MRLIFISLLLCSQAPKPALYGLGGGGGGLMKLLQFLVTLLSVKMDNHKQIHTFSYSVMVV